jgi:hypothetical protein
MILGCIAQKQSIRIERIGAWRLEKFCMIISCK